MEAKKDLLDTSCFFLLEVTGDSEDAAGADPFDLFLRSVHRQAEDDAESCSYETTIYEAFPGGSQVNSLKTRNFADGEDDGDEEEDRDSGGHSHSVGKVWRGMNKNKSMAGQQKSSVSVDSSVTIDEKEKSRRFWEQCLAS